MPDLEQRIRSAWCGRISGCQLGKPVERLSMRHGYDALTDYLAAACELPLRDCVGYAEVANVEDIDMLVARTVRLTEPLH